MLKIYSYGDGSWEVNGKITYAKEFAWDGCHKIYLLDDPEQKEQMLEYGYDFYPITELESTFNASCPLRFISNCALTESYVSQGEFSHEDEYY